MFFKKKTVKKQSHLDKVVTGVILGAAIGSVLGVGLAPKKGEDTRKDISKKANHFFGKLKDKILGKNKNIPLSARASHASLKTQTVIKKEVKTLPEEI